MIVIYSHHCEVRYEWITGARSPGSSTCPKQTDICIPVFHAARQSERCSHRSNRPMGRYVKTYLHLKKHVIK